MREEGGTDKSVEHGCILDPFQAVPTVHVVEDNEIVAAQGVELQIAEMVGTVAVQTGLEVGLGEIPHLGQTADLAAVTMGEGHCCMVDLQLVVVQERADCNDTVDFADFPSL